MKKVFTILGGVFLGIIVLVVVGTAIFAVKGNALDKESKQYVDDAVPAIVSQWDMAELQKRASPELSVAVKEGDVEKLFAMFRRLGKLKEYKGSKGDARISVTTEHGKVISAAYVANAEFEAGPGEITMSLIKHGDQWQILGIHVNSEVFLQQP